MNADHDTQLRLLDLAHADTALSQLAHRRSALPELVALADRARRAADLRNAVIDAQTAVDDLALAQRRLEDDVEAVRARASRDEQRMQAGGLPSRELEGLQHELTTLARRQGNLEDEVLEVMEQREGADAVLERLTADEAVLDVERADLEKVRDEAFVEIDAATAELRTERNAVAGALPADLLALYEKARAQGGTGAALLRARRCEACRIELPGSEIAAIRAAAPDAVVRCDDCRAILVRTEESGL